MLKKCLLLFIPVALFAAPEETHPWTDPWFTGPLFAPGAVVNGSKEVTWQPYFSVTCNYGTFNHKWKGEKTPNFWVIQPLLDLTYGMGHSMDLEITPAFSYQTSQGSSSIRMNDTPLFLGIQALRQTEGSWTPDLRIRLQTLFPLGQYQKANPKKKGTDLTGSGSYQMGITFDFQKTFQTGPQHYFRLRWSLESILYPTPVHVQGINAYGGGPHTSGKIYPGRTNIVFLSGEYTITHNWGFAFDTQYVYKSHDRFSGHSGGNAVGNPPSHQINLAPAIEYNYSANFGVIGGAYFSIAGKNATQFASGVISLVATY